MSSFAISITCPECGGDVEPVNGSSNGALTVAILACTGCPTQWEVCARLVPHASGRSLRSREDSRRKEKAGRQ